jgi:cell wall assembly regulator SMI1
MTEFVGLLARLDAAWQRFGFPVAETLAAGASPAEIRLALAPVSSSPCVEAVDWFSWHNGRRDAAAVAPLPPSMYMLLSLEQALKQRSERLEDAAELARSSGELNRPAEFYWRPTWLPIGGSLGPNVLAIDLAADAVKAPVLNIDWQDHETLRPVAESLTDAARLWVDVLDADYYAWSPEQRKWQYDFANFPIELRRSMLVD